MTDTHWRQASAGKVDGGGEGIVWGRAEQGRGGQNGAVKGWVDGRTRPGRGWDQWPNPEPFPGLDLLS